MRFVSTLTLVALLAACGAENETERTRAELEQTRIELEQAKTELAACRNTLAVREPTPRSSSEAVDLPSPPLPAGPQGAWSYSEHRDEMRDEVGRTACLRSSNAIDFDFPYNGGSYGSLCFRENPQFGFDAFFRVSKGQFLCGIYDCRVRVKVDDGPVQRLTVNPPASHDHDLLFFANNVEQRLLEQVRSSHRLVIEADFFRHGSAQFVFDDSSGLVWTAPTGAAAKKQRPFDPLRDIRPLKNKATF